MNKNNVYAAITEARRFIERATAAVTRTPKGAEIVRPGRARAALRRTSLDLTQTLAEMRKGK